MSLCEYKDFFGKPNEGMHQYRFLGFAAVDLGMSVLFALAVSYFFSIDFIKMLLVTLVAGVAAHKLFCVDTALNRRLGF